MGRVKIETEVAKRIKKNGRGKILLADNFLDLIEIEKDYADLFSWVKNGCY